MIASGVRADCPGRVSGLALVAGSVRATGYRQTVRGLLTVFESSSFPSGRSTLLGSSGGAPPCGPFRCGRARRRVGGE